MTKEKALEILQRQVRGINTMRGIRRFGASFTKWKRDTETAIREIFGHEYGHLVAFESISFGAKSWRVETKTPAKEAQEENAWQEGLEHSESILMSFIDEINDYWGDDGPMKKALNSPSKSDSASSFQSGEKKKVFVVHGRNSAARKAMFNFLRCLGLLPMEWSEAVRLTGKPSPFIGEILDAAFTKAQAVVVLLTPDDIAYLDHRFLTNDDPLHEKNPTPQARPNVLFEAGMAMGRDSDRTIFVELGKLRPFSDIYGRHVVRINNTTESRQDLADRLSAAGCEVDLSNRDWHSTGDFDGSIAATAANTDQVTSVSRDSTTKHAFEKVAPKMAKGAFGKLRGKMFDLFVEMKSDLEGDKSQLVREFVVLSSKGVVFNHDKARFEYHEDEHPMLQNKVDMLIESGLIVDVTPKEYPVYRMTEEFVEQLAAMQV